MSGFRAMSCRLACIALTLLLPLSCGGRRETPVVPTPAPSATRPSPSFTPPPALVPTATQTPSRQPTRPRPSGGQDWQRISPEQKGFSSVKLAEMLQKVKERGIGVDSLVVVRDGTLLMDAYYFPYHQGSVHDLASVTKSVIGLLIGIAADQGKLRLDDAMVSFFPSRRIQNLDDRKAKITVRHLVSMSNGMASGCQKGDLETIAAMEARPDWVQAALDRKMTRDPGTQFCYDSPGMHILSAILQQATGQSTLEFARHNLFAPLGIEQAVWDTDPQGITRGWGDLHLRPLDMARIGLMVLNGGVWEGQQVVSAAYLQQATTPQAHNATPDDYGFGWWVCEDGPYASGLGGQSIRVFPELDLVAVMTACGSDWDAVSGLLEPTLLSEEKALPPDPAGEMRLAEQISAIAARPPAKVAVPLPQAALDAAGLTYRFPANSALLVTLRLEARDADQVTLHLTWSSSNEEQAWPVGLDGNYRLSAYGDALRGDWVQDNTLSFVLRTAREIGIKVTLDGKKARLVSSSSGIEVEGQAQ